MAILDALHEMYDPQAHIVRFNAARLQKEMPELGKFLASLFGTSQLNISGVQQPPAPGQDQDSVQLSGTGISFGPPALFVLGPGDVRKIRFQFLHVSQQPVLLIEIALATFWSFSQSFPTLKHTFWDGVSLDPTKQDDNVAVLLIASDAATWKEHKRTLSKGMSFWGYLATDKGLLQQVNWFYGSQASEAFGTIAFEDTAQGAMPLITLTLPETQISKLFKEFNLPVTMTLDNAKDPSASGMAICATLPWVRDNITLCALISQEDEGVLYVKSTTPIDLPTPQEIHRYLGGVDVISQLTPTFKVPNLQISEFAVGVGLFSQQIEYIHLKISASQELTIISDPKTAIAETAVAFNLYQPFTEQQSYSIIVGGRLYIGDVDFLVVGQIPGMQIAASLAPDQVISLTNIAKHFKLPDGAPEIDITELSLAANTSGYYYIAAQLEDRSIDTAKPKDKPDAGFVLRSLLFELERQPGKDPQIDVQGLLEIKGMVLYLEVDNTQGWDFLAKTQQDQDIPLGHLLDELTEQFGLELPNALRQLTIKNVLLRFNASGGNFHFECTCDFPLDDQNQTRVEISALIDVTRDQHPGDGQPATYHKDVKGTLTIGKSMLDCEFISDGQGDRCTAEWKLKDDTEKPLGFADIAKVFGFDLPPIPESLDLGLKDVSLQFNFTTQTLAIKASSANYGTAFFVSVLDENKKRIYLFGVEILLGITLSQIPLVGNKIPSAETLGLREGAILIASADVPKGATLNALLSLSSSLGLNSSLKLPEEGLSHGVTLEGTLKLGESDKSLSLPLTPSAKPANQPPLQPPPPVQPAEQPGGLMAVPAPAPPTTFATGSTLKWFDVQKTFGPFAFRRIGVGYENNKLIFALDASMLFGPLTFDLQGLSAHLNLASLKGPSQQGQPTEAPLTFSLDGLGLSFVEEPVEMMGAFLKVPTKDLSDTQFMYDGLVVIKLKNFTLEAIGSYAQQKSGDPSLFVFGVIEAPLGGPPFLYVTGLAAGFGYNRHLTSPAQEEVLDFPLMALGRTDVAGQKRDPMDILAILDGQKADSQGKTRHWLSPQVGEYWFAAGLEFTSFQFIHSRLLAIAAFVPEFQLLVLGLSTMQLPHNASDPYVRLELEIEAVLKPAQSFFGVTAVLSPNSYVISPSAHLTGGFALYLWYSGEHSGKFVLTIGGYHPAFTPPPYYPQEQRVSLNWAVSDTVSISGGAYFALTPSCIMTGGSLHVLFHSGNLSAWLTAYFDVLISWKPFFYKATIGISVGMSYRFGSSDTSTTLSVEVSLTLELSGPPTSGKAHIDWFIISFTIAFGADKDASISQDALTWEQFSALLPEPGNICKITITDGLQKTSKGSRSEPNHVARPPVNANQPPNDAQEPPNSTWIVRADRFAFTTEAAIPSKNLIYGSGRSINTPYDFSIRPMNQNSVDSTHRLTITREGDENPLDISKWELKPLPRNMPESLWGRPLKDADNKFVQVPSTPSASTVPQMPVGIQVTAPRPQPGKTPGIILMQTLAYEPITPDGKAPLSPSVSPSKTFLPSFKRDTIGKMKDMMGEAQQKRTLIYKLLEKGKIYSGEHGSLDRMAAQREHLYADAPLQV